MSPLNITQPLGIWSTRWLLYGDVQYSQNGIVTNPWYLRILPAVHIGRALIETKNEQKHDETRIAVIQVSGCYKAWFLVPANQASTRASHRWGVDHHALYLVVQESWQTTWRKIVRSKQMGKKTYNILRWPCHRNFCDILAPWLAPSPLFRLRSAQPSRVFWIQRPTVNVVSNTWWGKWLRLLTHGGHLENDDSDTETGRDCPTQRILRFYPSSVTEVTWTSNYPLIDSSTKETQEMWFLNHIWRFPKMMVPPKHPKLIRPF